MPTRNSPQLLLRTIYRWAHKTAGGFNEGKQIIATLNIQNSTFENVVCLCCGARLSTLTSHFHQELCSISTWAGRKVFRLLAHRCPRLSTSRLMLSKQQSFRFFFENNVQKEKSPGIASLVVSYEPPAKYSCYSTSTFFCMLFLFPPKMVYVSFAYSDSVFFSVWCGRHFWFLLRPMDVNFSYNLWFTTSSKSQP